MSAPRFPRITWEVISSLVKLTDVPGLFMLDEQTVLKTGLATYMTEAAALRLVRENTSIPVPEVYEAYMREDQPDCCAIIVEYIEGDVLDDVWASLDPNAKGSIVKQLNGYMNELRSLSANYIGAVGDDGAPCIDQIFSQYPEIPYGPFKTEQEFREGCIKAMYKSRDTPWTTTVAGFIRTLPAAEIVSTHNDLHPRNIIVREGVIVGIFDWELSGYYPEYWEYVKSWYRVGIDQPWVQERAIDEVLTPYRLAHAVF